MQENIHIAYNLITNTRKIYFFRRLSKIHDFGTQVCLLQSNKTRATDLPICRTHLGYSNSGCS